ncbi:MAG: hypothetical protein LBF93_04580 [Zoogloeaceae bacterium]|nr:hypothetical protein [Zoogloeaceae bacterium]
MSALLLLPLPAAAGFLFKSAGFDCQSGRDRLILTYDETVNGTRGEIAENARAAEWALWELVSHDEKDFIRDMRKGAGTCSLSDGEYRIEIYPNPGNANFQGKCGVWMGARAKVEKDGRTLFDEDFDNSCQQIGSPIIRRVLIRPGKEPVRRVSDNPLGLLFTAACQPEQGQLRLGFAFAATHDHGQEPPGVTDVEDLFQLVPDYKALVLETTDLKASCRLADGEYRYVLSPFGNSCGIAKKWVNARLAITRDGKTIHDAPFARDCADPQAPVVRGVTLRSGKEPKVDTAPADLFYDPDDDPEGGAYNPAPVAVE